MGTSTWAAMDVAHLDAVDADVAAQGDVAPHAGTAGIRQRAKGLSARDRFVPLQRSRLRLVPPLPDVSAVDVTLSNEPWLDRRATRDMPATDDGEAGAGGRADELPPIGVRQSSASASGNAMAAQWAIPPAGSTQVRARGAHAPVRLTRRGRVVVAGLLLMLVASMIAVLASTVQAAAPPGQPRAVVVHQGDTLWSIAARVHPRGSLTETMLAIERLNHMSDGTVYVGQRLLVPTS
jgi:LysM repeat protein